MIPYLTKFPLVSFFPNFYIFIEGSSLLIGVQIAFNVIMHQTLFILNSYSNIGI
jgi:hypothetical protein